MSRYEGMSVGRHEGRQVRTSMGRHEGGQVGGQAGTNKGRR